MTEILLRLSDAANRALRVEDLFEPALDAVCAALRVDRASILLLDENRVMRFRAWRGLSEGYRKAVDGHSPWRPDETDARSIFVADTHASPVTAPYVAIFDAEGIRALGFIPLIQQGRLLGKFMVYAREPRAFTEQDERFAQAIAAQVSQAVFRAELLESERRERQNAQRLAERASRLQSVTAALSNASSVNQVVSVIAGDVAKLAGAMTVGLWLRDEAHGVLELVESRGYVNENAGRFRRVRLDGSVKAAEVDAARTGEPTFVGGVATLPLLVDGRIVGVLSFTFDAGHEFGADERRALLALAQQSAQALGRARLFDLEARARAEAESAQQRTAFLLEASAVLSSSLDFQETLQKLARLAVPRMADWCAVELATEAGRPSEQLAVAHVDPAKVALATELRRRWPPEPDQPRGILHVIRSGEAELYSEIDDRLLAAGARDEEHLHALRDVGFTSAMIVPMTARGRTFGAITFVAAESRVRYGKLDLDLAEHLGRRAGVAIDNALLYRTAQEAIRAREKVLAVVSHDLRNPLNVVQLSAGALLHDPGDAALVARKAESILKSSERMAKLIRDLLDFASMHGEGFKIEPRPCALEEIVASSIEMFAETAREKSVHLRGHVVPAIPLVECDRDRLIQALGNLISNAVKITPAGGTVKVEAESAGEEVALSVVDTGPGIAAEDLARLFEPFQRGENPGYQGTGLGLAIAKGITDAHGGRIGATSVPGSGSRFTITLPRPRSAAALAR